MQHAFDAARYTEAGEIYDEAYRSAVEGPPVDMTLLRARIYLKLGSKELTPFLLRKFSGRLTAAQAGRKAMYLGSGFARLGDFQQADRYFSDAKKAFPNGPVRAELATHISRRYLLARDFLSAEEWQRATLVDRSAKGKIRSEHLRSYILARQERYSDQADSVLRVLDLIGDDVSKYLEDWYVGVYTLAGLAREIAHHKAVSRAVAEVSREIEWSPDFRVQHFQALKAVGWCRALKGDDLGCLRYLRLAGHAAPSAIWRVRLFLDRSYFASIMNEQQWAANEFSAAEDLAEAVAWESTNGEERIALLLFAELATRQAPERAPYYIARFNELGKLHNELQHFTFDDRVNAMSAYSSGLVKLSLRDSTGAETDLRSAWGTFDRIGYDVRAARSALALYDATGKERWKLLAEDKLEAFPLSWLTRAGAMTSGPDQQTVPTVSLPKMQLTITRLVCQGLSTTTMAEQLHLSRFTILNHLKAIYKKLGINSREALVVEALRRRIV
jgi:DNA-binding CsgD family transcriptional regulator